MKIISLKINCFQCFNNLSLYDITSSVVIQWIQLQFNGIYRIELRVQTSR